MFQLYSENGTFDGAVSFRFGQTFSNILKKISSQYNYVAFNQPFYINAMKTHL